MRIAYCLLQFPVLSQTFIVNEIVELLREGHEVFIFSASHPRSRAYQPLVEEHGLLARSHYLPVVANLVQGLPASELMPDLLRDTFDATRKGTRILEDVIDFTAANYFANLAEKLNIDILHSHFHGTASALTALIARKAELPFTFTCHALDIFVDPDPRVMRRHFDAACAVITVSNYNKEYLQAITGVDAHKIAIVRACSDLERFLDLERRDNGRTLVSIGRLVEKKGLSYAIEAFAQVLPAYPGLRYRIVGGGPLEEELRNLAASLGIADSVQFTGAVDQTQVVRELQQATMEVLPCVRAGNGDLDGAPLTLQEAMVAGVPVVASTAASIPELIRNGTDGLLVEPRDSDALATAIRAQLDSPQCAHRMALSARSRVLDCFNIHTEVGKLLEVWQRACHGNAPGLASACEAWLHTPASSHEESGLTHF